MGLKHQVSVKNIHHTVYIGNEMLQKGLKGDAISSPYLVK